MSAGAFEDRAWEFTGPAMSINQQWHDANPMPKKATMVERVAWHLAHQQHCGCRSIPRTVGE
jgi:hypothetical protein